MLSSNRGLRPGPQHSRGALLAYQTGPAHIAVTVDTSRKEVTEQALSSGPALYRGLGSIGFVGVARTVLLVGRKGDLRYVTVVGSNSREAPALAFDIRSSARDRNIGVLEWLDGDVTVSAEELCAQGPGAAHEVGAAAWLRTRLSAGPVRSGELYEEGRRAGFAQRTLERARDKAGVSTVKNGTGWVWKLV